MGYRSHEIGGPPSNGRGQIILHDRHGSYCGGTEPRTDSLILPW